MDRVAVTHLRLPQAMPSRRILRPELVGDELNPSWGEDEDVSRCRGRFVVAVTRARERDALRLLCAGDNGKNNKKG